MYQQGTIATIQIRQETLLDLFFIEPAELARCHRQYPQIIKLLGFLLRIFKEAKINEKDLVSMFDRSVDE